MPGDWKSLSDDELAALWNRGWTQRRIAEEFGVSAGAVSGRLNRLRKNGKIVLRTRDMDAIKRGRQRRSMPRFKLAFSAPPEARIVPLEALDAAGRECRWPVRSDRAKRYLFCGAPVEEGKPYCPHHCRRAYVRRERGGGRNGGEGDS